MSGLQSLYSLLDKRLDLPCIKAAEEFLSSLKSENDRHSLATNGLVPLLENGDIKTSLRVLAAYLLHVIYHFSNTPNPYYDRLCKLYKIQRIRSLPASELHFQTNTNPQQERTQVASGFGEWQNRNLREKHNSYEPSIASSHFQTYSDATEAFLSPPETNKSPFECVLWKILNGEANELNPFSATTLADVNFWEPAGYQRGFDNDSNIPSNRGYLPSNVMPAMPAMKFDSNPYHRPTHTAWQSPSTSSPHHSSISHNNFFSDTRRQLSDNVISSNHRLFSQGQGQGQGHATATATAPPTTQRSMAAPGSSRPSPVTYPSQLSPSPASSTLESSSVRTPSSFVDTSTFALPRTDPTRQVDASIFHIPQINRWSTPSEAALGPGDDLKSLPPPRVAARRISPMLSSKPLQPVRNPGVIGSGRPSSTSPSEPSSERSAESRASYIGIVGDNAPGRYSPALEELGMQGLSLKQQNVSTAPRVHPSNGSVLYRTGDSDNLQHSFLTSGSHQAWTSTATSFPSSVSLSVPQGNLQAASQVDGHVGSLMNATNLRTQRNIVSQDDSRDAHGGTVLPVQLDADMKADTYRESDDHMVRNKQASHPKLGPGLSVDLPIPQHQGSSYPQLDLKSQQENGVDPEAIRERDELADAIVLYLMARERVLTLQEQKKLQPHLSMLTRPICILRPEDIPSLVANNQDIAVKLLLFLFNQDEKDARQIEELLKKVDLEKDRSGLGSDSRDSLSLISEMTKLVSSYGLGRDASSRTIASSDDDISPPLLGSFAMRRYLVALAELPPTIQSFSVVGKLLMPNQSGQSFFGEDSKRVATLIRTEVLGGFISGCIRWIEKVDRDEKEGRVHDDRVATAVGNLCRFYTSLIKNGIIAANSEEDTTEIMSFALQFSRFDAAQKLYSILAAARA